MDDNQPVMTTDENGNKSWRLPCGRYHRTDGPAVEWADGDKYWWYHDEIHRTDGPAVEQADGGKEWWLRGKPLFFDEWLDQNPDMTGEEKVMYKLTHG